MSQITPTDRGLGLPNEQQTVMQDAPDASVGDLHTAIKADPQSPRLEVGPVPLTRVAQYELIKEIGRGGMGVVFKARDVRLNRIVALKMIRGGALANTDELQRFEKEAAAAAQLIHPNIVALYEVSPNDQQPYLSMEFIGGTSLAERLLLGPLPSRRAAAYLEQTARAVHYAHTRGIVHRDLKPANVLLDENDQTKVTDFGLAKQIDNKSDQTRTGAILGTPSYMSPEQAAGRKEISPASDVYSLGAILYELITGKPPFCGETPLATLNLVAEQDPIAPRLLNPAVDRDLETICLKCLEKSPARRYKTADALADDLKRYLAGEPIAARRVGVFGRSVKWVQRNPALFALSTLCILSVSGFIAYQQYEASQEKMLRGQAETANKLAAVRLQTMRHLFYLSQMRQAHQTLRRADLNGLQRIIHNELFQPKEGQRDIRDWEWYFFLEQTQSRLAFGTHTGRASAVIYRPDGTQIISAGGEPRKEGEIRIRDARTGKVQRTIPAHTDVISYLACHPTKAVLASSSYDHTVKLWDLETGMEIMTLRGHTDLVTHVAFSPSGNLLASCGADRTVRIWDYSKYLNDPAESVQILSGHGREVTAVAFHPDEQHLLSASRDRTIRIWSVATGNHDRTLTGHEGEVMSLAIGAMGKTIVSGGGLGNQRGEMIVWDFESGKIRTGHYGFADRINEVAVSHNGKIAAAGSDGFMYVWNPKISSEALRIRADPQAVAGVAFAPDGLTLATASLSGRVSLWNSSAGLEALTLTAPGMLETVAFHPNEPYIAAAGVKRSEVRVWKLDQANQPILLKGHRSGVSTIAFAPNGRHLASASLDRTVRIVDFRDPGIEPIIIEGHNAPVHTLAYHPDGKMLASAGDDETIRLSDPASGKLIKLLTGHKNGILCLAFSADGKWLASAGYDRTIRIWNLLDSSQNVVLEGHTGLVNTLAFNPDDGKTLASAGTDHAVLLWDINQKKQVFKLEGAAGKIQSLAFHPNGRRLVCIGQDRMIRLWDIVTRQEILELEEYVGVLRAVAFSPDGRSLAAAGLGVVRVWQASHEMPAPKR